MAATRKLMAVQGAALIVGSAFLIIGVLGFIPGATTHHELLQWAGHRLDAKLFGVFAVSGLLNVLHLAIGAAGLVMARSYAMARAYFLASGAVYLALWAYGFFISNGSQANVVGMNDADNWLHFGLGLGMLLLAVTLAGQHDPTKRSKRRARVRA
jgi:uncharacterized protein DUF4383